MTDKDVERIVKMRFSPINISVHTTNPELRVKMMKNKRSGEVLKYLGEFKRAGLTMCAQIVLCKGVNDGDELLRSMRDLAEYAPELNSLAVVPAGLTKYRDGLYPLADFTPDEASEIIDMVKQFGDECYHRFGMRLVYAADEFYIKAGREIPDADYYEDYSQLENGVGMIRSFSDEVEDAISDADELISSLNKEREVSVITGAASYAMISEVAKKVEALTDKIKINVFEIKNYFFGESITVSGLLTGKDIYEQIKDKHLGDAVILPANCLRDGEDIFLCGMTLDDFKEKIKTDVRVAENDGYDFIDAVFGIERW
jgi:putative radical SAM enzyme (TIGR03279 family)